MAFNGIESRAVRYDKSSDSGPGSNIAVFAARRGCASLTAAETEDIANRIYANMNDAVISQLLQGKSVNLKTVEGKMVQVNKSEGNAET